MGRMLCLLHHNSILESTGLEPASRPHVLVFNVLLYEFVLLSAYNYIKGSNYFHFSKSQVVPFRILFVLLLLVCTSFYCRQSGFEPEQTEPQSVRLPLPHCCVPGHNRPCRDLNPSPESDNLR